VKGKEKKNGGGGVGWRGEGLMGWWAAWAERSRAGFVFFFSFSKLLFQTIFQL
jgi:hypothetical protein